MSYSVGQLWTLFGDQFNINTRILDVHAYINRPKNICRNTANAYINVHVHIKGVCIRCSLRRMVRVQIFRDKQEVYLPAKKSTSGIVTFRINLDDIWYLLLQSKISVKDEFFDGAHEAGLTEKFPNKI